MVSLYDIGVAKLACESEPNRANKRRLKQLIDRYLSPEEFRERGLARSSEETARL